MFGGERKIRVLERRRGVREQRERMALSGEGAPDILCPARPRP
jgi:hypothetical protein